MEAEFMASSIISSQTDGSSQSQDDRLAELCNILTLEDRPGLIDGDHKDAMLLTKKALSAEAVASALETLMYADEKIHDWERDTVIGNLLWQEAGQKCLAQLLTANPTNAFRSLWKLTGRSMQGSQGMNGLVRTCMSPAIWSDESIRLQALQDVLRLLLAKLVEPDGGRYGIAMKAIAQLMAVHAKELESVLDESNFAIILDHLSIENDAALRSQAILAIAKFIEVANNRAQTMLKDYIKLNIAKHNNDDAVKGFSAAAAMFPILPDQASKLLLSSGFLDDLANIVRKSSSRRLRCAALELLSAACVSKDCRASISSTCSAWLRVVTKEKDTDDVPLAALVLSKISQEGGNPVKELIPVCKRIIMKNDGHTNTANFNAQIAIEALAYSTTQPELKQDLADEPPVLARIMQIVIADPTNRPLIYGALIIMANLTDYTPELTAEQQRMAQLKAYANQSKPVESSPKDKPEKVTERCAVLGESGLITMLVKTAKEASPTSLALISKISLNLAKERKHAGPMLQEGIFDILLPIAAYKGEDTSLNHAMAAAARTLARLLIPFDPRLIFAGSGPNGRRDTAVPLVVRLLRSLLDDPTIEDPRVPFEALQALTNLASMDEQVATLITEQAFISVESYLTSNLSAQQQAAIECMANLTTCQACSNMFIASGECRFPPDYEGESELDHREETRFCRLVALTEDEARGIRLSAMAALYNVCESLPGARMLSDYHSGFEQVVPQLEATVGQRGDSPDGEMRARAAGVVYNVLRHGDEAVTKMLMERNVEQKLEASKKKDPTGTVVEYVDKALWQLRRNIQTQR